LAQIFKSIPIQYYILVISDWTEFHLKEGGKWSNIKREYIRGKGTAIEEEVLSDKRIRLAKHDYDETPVEVRINCTLNIFEEYRDSDIIYLTEKGDIKSTTVRIIVEGKEITSPLENDRNDPRNERNPREFPVPVARHLPTSKLRKIFRWMKRQWTLHDKIIIFIIGTILTIITILVAKGVL